MSKPKCREIGRLTMTEGEPRDTLDYEYKIAMVIELATPEDLHKALDAGSVEFDWP